MADIPERLDIAALLTEEKEQLKKKLQQVALPGALFKHLKSSGMYRIVATATIEASMTPAIVYESLENGRVWVRPQDEFFDGRFQYCESLEIKDISVRDILKKWKEYISTFPPSYDTPFALNYDNFSSNPIITEVVFRYDKNDKKD